jgi:hypothetical protein
MKGFSKDSGDISYSNEEVLIYPSLKMYALLSCETRIQSLISNFLLSMRRGFSRYFCKTKESDFTMLGTFSRLVKLFKI